jgi:hypothetical protein
MWDQSDRLEPEDRRAYAEQVPALATLLSFQMALAFYKAIGSGSDSEEDSV